MRKTDLLTWASFSFFISYHPSADLTLAHFLTLTLKRVHTLVPAAKTKSDLSWSFSATDTHCLKLVLKHDISRSIVTCGGTLIGSSTSVSVCWPPTCISTSTRQRSPLPGRESCVRSGTMQIDAALNEQRIMLATSVERALKNSCFVSGMAVVRLCIHWIIYQASQTEGLNLY